MKTEIRKATEGVQRRAFEVRSDSAKYEISGRAVRYNAISQNLGGFVERVLPGAFAASLRTDDQKLYWSHDSSVPLARKSNGTLVISDSPDALTFTAKLNRNVTAHCDAFENVRSGLVKEMSFGFSVLDQDWDEIHNPLLRTVKTATLYEISLVTEPAYAGGATAAEARANVTKTLKERGLAEAIKILRKAAAMGAREFERVLRAGTGDEPAIMRYASRLQRAHEMGELSAGMIQDCYHRSLDKDLDDEDGEIDDLTRGAVAVAHAAAAVCAENCAAARLYHARALEAKKKKK